MRKRLIEAVDIKKSYWVSSLETSVLKGIGFSIEEASCIAITGPSGAGKSTFLHILASLDPPTEGQVFFKGQNLYAEKDEVLSRIRNSEIGFVFQFHHLLPEFTALENTMMPLLIRGEKRKKARQRAEEVLERMSLSYRSHHRPAELSGGEQQRVAIARAIVGRPGVLFADEPTGNLDRENGERLMSHLLELQSEEGMAIVLVTHNEGLASQFPQRFHLADGHLTPS